MRFEKGDEKDICEAYVKWGFIKKQSCKLLREKGEKKEKKETQMKTTQKKDWLAGECLEVWFNTANNLTKHISALLN